MLVYNWVYTTPAMGIGGAIFFGYSSALLGISGFESSSNYVENQKPGVFPKTLRNMWVRIQIKRLVSRSQCFDTTFHYNSCNYC